MWPGSGPRQARCLAGPRSAGGSSADGASAGSESAGSESAGSESAGSAGGAGGASAGSAGGACADTAGSESAASAGGAGGASGGVARGACADTRGRFRGRRLRRPGRGGHGRRRLDCRVIPARPVQATEDLAVAQERLAQPLGVCVTGLQVLRVGVVSSPVPRDDVPVIGGDQRSPIVEGLHRVAAAAQHGVDERVGVRYRLARVVDEAALHAGPLRGVPVVLLGGDVPDLEGVALLRERLEVLLDRAPVLAATDGQVVLGPEPLAQGRAALVPPRRQHDESHDEQDDQDRDHDGDGLHASSSAVRTPPPLGCPPRWLPPQRERAGRDPPRARQGRRPARCGLSGRDGVAMAPRSD